MNGGKKIRPRLSLKEHYDLELYLTRAFNWYSLYEGSNEPDAEKHREQIKYLTKKLKQIMLSRGK